MTNREKLAQYQRELLDLLHNCEDPRAAAIEVERLQAEFILVEVEDMATRKPQERMVDVAMKLTKKWAVPKSP